MTKRVHGLFEGQVICKEERIDRDTQTTTDRERVDCRRCVHLMDVGNAIGRVGKALAHSFEGLVT